MPLTRTGFLAGAFALPFLWQPPSRTPPLNVPGFRYTSKGEPVVPLMFPMLNGCEWQDTHGAPRGGGKRKHIGQDLPAEKLRPLLACFDGIWTGMGLRGDNGCSAAYYHLNNDQPGTDDGKGGEEYRVAPGVWPGVRVQAGQHVAYCGDSGNAEATISHLHFELYLPGIGVVNAAPSLRVATVLKEARYTFEQPDFKPDGKLLRLDGEVVSVSGDGKEYVTRIAAWGNVKGKVTPAVIPLRRTIRVTGESEPVAVGDFIAAIGKADPDDKRDVEARAVRVLRKPTGQPPRYVLR